MDPLEQLKDVHIPDPIQWWPLAIGWWVVIGIIVLSIIGITTWLIMRYKKRQGLRAALSELSLLQAQDPNWQSKLNALLKRVTMHYYPAEAVAPLYGQTWRDFLLSQIPPKQHSELELTLGAMIENLYRCNENPNQTQVEFSSTLNQAATWMKVALPPKNRQLREVEDV